jgi:hypothetical protein
MHVRLGGCMWCYDNWNRKVPTIKRDIELNINIRLLHIPSWWVTILSQCLVSSNWTQRIRSLVNFITYFEPPYLLDYNYIVVPFLTGFFVNAYRNGEGVEEFLTKRLQTCPCATFKRQYIVYGFNNLGKGEPTCMLWHQITMFELSNNWHYILISSKVVN